MVVLVTIFSEYLKNVPVPVPTVSFNISKVNSACSHCCSIHKEVILPNLSFGHNLNFLIMGKFNKSTQY